MVDKYLYRDPTTGLVTEREGTVEGGSVSQAGDIPALDTSGRLSPSVMPVGIGADTASLDAGETLLAGDFVYIKNDGTAWKASAAISGTEAIGFVLDSADPAEAVLVYFEGRNTGLTALTPGARYYLSDTTAGGLTATPVAGAGKKHQFLGRAITATSLAFEADDPITLA